MTTDRERERERDAGEVNIRDLKIRVEGSFKQPIDQLEAHLIVIQYTRSFVRCIGIAKSKYFVLESATL